MAIVPLRRSGGAPGSPIYYLVVNLIFERHLYRAASIIKMRVIACPELG
jgi:hypothetical protein